MMAPRYALYFAPATESLLWQRASEWLGRDAATGAILTRSDAIGIAPDRLSTLTNSACRYGFHATLKAPFHLANGFSRDDLFHRLEEFGKTRDVLDPIVFAPRLLGGFLALMPVDQPPSLVALAADIVADFDFLRRPMSDEERDKRLAKGLSHRQAELLDQYGYPYVMDEFRMHMTLTDHLTENERAELLAAGTEWLAPAIAEPISISAISVFEEPKPGAAFIRIAEFPLAEKQHAATG